MRGEMEDLRFVFRDAIYYYCLDLYHCTEGKKMVCEHIHEKEAEYMDKSQRSRAIQRCKAWKIAVKYGEPSVKLRWKAKTDDGTHKKS